MTYEKFKNIGHDLDSQSMNQQNNFVLIPGTSFNSAISYHKIIGKILFLLQINSVKTARWLGAFQGKIIPFRLSQKRKRKKYIRFHLQYFYGQIMLTFTESIIIFFSIRSHSWGMLSRINGRAETSIVNNFKWFLSKRRKKIMWK